MRVGIREFCADLTEYIAASSPVAVTRHSSLLGGSQIGMRTGLQLKSPVQRRSSSSECTEVPC